ncbi:MAG: nuclear transport factor 2 family protein [Pseudomonadota bacterium]
MTDAAATTTSTTSSASTAIDVIHRGHWTDEERRNVELVAEFVGLVMNEHDYEAARERFGSNSYVQHSRGIPDRMEGIIDYLDGLTKRFPEYRYDVRHVHADGEFVTFHSHATMKAKHRGDERQGFNIIDTWRIADGEIAEHWDAIQPLSFSMRLFALVAGGRIKNSNSIY